MTDEQYTKLLSRVVTNRSTCGGIPIIKGTRIGIYIILANLADGLTPEEIVEEYPSLKLDDVRAAIIYAAEEARDIRDARRAIAEAKRKGVISWDELKEQLDKKNATKKTGKKASKKSNVKR